MRISAIIFLLFSGVIAHGQLITVPLSSKRSIQTTQKLKQIELPFWDDFSSSGDSPDTLLWNGGFDIFVNDALSLNTPTYKAATFDGLRGNGTAYEIENDLAGITDTLATHQIDLSGLNLVDSVYLSFFWQAGGLSELPDEEDTLSLDFYGGDLEWHRIWAKGGAEKRSDFFTQEMVHLDDPIYYHDKFRFRFRLLGKRNGPFDTWHLDYVYLNKSRFSTDTLHFDRSLTGKPTALFGIYREIPANVFFSDPGMFLNHQSIESKNLDNTPHSVQYFYKLENLTTSEVYIDSEIPGASVDLSPLEFDVISTSFSSSISAQTNPLDSQVLQTTFSMFTGDKNLFEEVNGTDTVFLNPDLKINDTIRQTYTLQNHYAYDDGIAEFAGGINEANGKLAVRYGIPQPDTLTHIDIHFPNIDPGSEGKSINIMVWTNGGNTLLTSQSHTISLNTKKNEFQRIKLNKTQLIRDTVYVGFQQLDDDYLPVGFDNTSPEAKGEIFFTKSGVWTQNERLNGVFMIRPVFQFDSTFVLSNKKQAYDLIPHPNPSKGIIRFNETIDLLTVYSLDGALMYKSSSKNSYDISSLQNGIYLLKVKKGDTIISSRLILNK
ncbi:MAG: T9SS type A sorting domain-containing protein [Cyclobacteriaceae bacterium]